MSPAFLLLAFLCSLSAACGTGPPATRVLFNDPRGSVALRPVDDRTFRATHPIDLEPALLARILSGILIQEQQRGLQSLLSGTSDSVAVFSPGEVQFLAPLLANALSTAAADQVVEFVLTTPRAGAIWLEYATTETTAGSLYASGTLLGFSLSQYRYTPTRTSTENIAHRRLPDSSGLADRTLLVGPGLAEGSGHVARPAGFSHDKFLAIDYQQVAMVPSRTAAPERAAPRPTPTPDLAATPSREIPPQARELLEQRDEEIRTLKDLVIKKDVELETIRKNLQSLRKQLDDLSTRTDSQKRKTKPPSKPQQTTP